MIACEYGLFRQFEVFGGRVAKGQRGSEPINRFRMPGIASSARPPTFPNPSIPLGPVTIKRIFAITGPFAFAGRSCPAPPFDRRKRPRQLRHRPIALDRRRAGARTK